ncbi:MAG: endonuclease III [Puniceicoccales bacterium]|jgi:endonuclease-3|nr:endonuclease III [Puniceicoccales bacterium]
MNKLRRANFILRKLEELFPNPQVQLDFSSSFTCLVAVMLSAQCTDVAVNAVTKKLFAVASTPLEFVTLGESGLREIIRPCGLFNTKARAIVGTSRIILQKYDGNVPDSMEELETLPGVGHKTASVIVSQCFNGPAFPVDTHIARLANRWQLETSRDTRKIEGTLKELFPVDTWKTLHLQLILYGRKFCPARWHDIGKCPICLKFSLDL